MIVDLNAKNTTTASLSPGDVFIAHMFSQYCIAMVLAQMAPRTTIAILKAENVNRPLPLYMDLANPTRCLSLGSDCVLEPIIGDDTAPGATFEDKFGAGILALDDEGVLSMMLHPYDSFSNTEVSYDLRKLEFTSGSSSYYNSYFSHWKLWRSEADQRRDGAEPLIDFAYQPFVRRDR